MQYAVCSMQYAVCSMQYAVCSKENAELISYPKIKKESFGILVDG